MSKSVFFWIYKFDPQVITIDDLRHRNTFFSADPKPQVNDVLLFLNGNSGSLEAVGKILTIGPEKKVSVQIVHKPRQKTCIKKVCSHLPKALSQEIRKSDFSDFIKLNRSCFDGIIATWWGIDNYSQEFCGG